MTSFWQIICRYSIKAFIGELSSYRSAMVEVDELAAFPLLYLRN